MREARKSRTENNNYLSLYDTYKKYDNPYNVTKQEFSLIVKSFFFVLVKELIYGAKNFTLPNRLGILGIRKIPTIGRGYFDYKTYRTTGVRRYIKNNHSEQLAAKTYWFTSFNRVRDYLICIYKFIPSRGFTREIAQHIKNNNAISSYYDK